MSNGRQNPIIWPEIHIDGILGIFNNISMIDALIISGFLLLTLFTGIWFAKKFSSVREYAIGNRNLSNGALVSTIVATWLSGHSFSFIACETSRDGLYFIMPLIADALSFLIISYFYAPRMQEFLGAFSIAEAMGNMFGRDVRGVVAISGTIVAICMVGMQFTILTYLLQNFLGITNIYAIIISAFVIIIYSSFIGVKCITFTHVMQLLTFGVIIPVTIICIWFAIDSNASSIVKALETHPAFDMHNILDYQNPKFMNSVGVFFFFLIPSLDPAHFQRISMASSVKQVARTFAMSSMVILLGYLLFNFMGIVLITDPNIPVNVSYTETHSLVAYIANHYLEVGFKGIFVIGVMALCMSTTDAYLSAGAVLFAHDFCQTIEFDLPEEKHLPFTRYVAFFIGVVGLILGTGVKNMWSAIYMAYNFYMPVVSVPMMLAIFGFRSTKTSVLLGMFAGLSTVILLMIFSEIQNVILLGMLANLVIYMGSHYFLWQPGGWIKTQNKSELPPMYHESEGKLQINKQRVNISKLAHDTIELCKKLYLNNKILQFDAQIEENVYATCDRKYILNTIENLVKNAIEHSNPKTTIKIVLKQDKSDLEFSIREEGMGIPKNQLFEIFRPFNPDSQMPELSGYRGSCLAHNYAAILAHHGKMWAESDGKIWTEFKFEI